MNAIIRDYLNAIRKQLTHLPLREREAVLDEIQDHLTTETKRLRKEDKSLSDDEAALRATHAFGDPSEIGVAYGAGGGVVNRSTGELLLDVAVLSTRAAGRGIKGLLKWTGIIIGTAVVTTLLVAIVLLVFAGGVVDTFQDEIRESIPHPLYRYTGQWYGDQQAHTEFTSDSFEVRDGTKEFWISIDIQPYPSATSLGCAQVVLTAPDGSVAYDSGTDCGADSRDLVFTQAGTWQISYNYVAYQGSVYVDATYFEEVS